MAGSVNQFLGTHTSQVLYAGTLKNNQSTATPFYTDTETQWLGQQIVMSAGQTSIGKILMRISTVGGSPITENISPLTLSLYASSGASPTGSPLASTSVVSTYVYSSPVWVTIPLPVSGLTAGVAYYIVVTKVGTAGHYYAWQRSDQVSGAVTSPDGIIWTNHTYGFTFQVFDQSAAGGGPVQVIYEDGGARRTSFTYNANGTINTVTEFTYSPTSGVNLQSSRTMTYANGLLTGIV